MDSLDLKELLNLPMLIKIVDLLESFSKEELAFINIHLSMHKFDLPSDVVDKLNDIRFKEFKKKSKKLLTTKSLKVTKDTLINEVVSNFDNGTLDISKLSILSLDRKEDTLIYEVLNEKIGLSSNNISSLRTLSEFVIENFCNPMKTSNSYNIAAIYMCIDFARVTLLKDCSSEDYIYFSNTVITGLLCNYTFLSANYFKEITGLQNKESKMYEKVKKEIEKLKETNSKLRKSKVDLDNECRALKLEKSNKSIEFNKVIENINSQFVKSETNYEKLVKEIKDVKSSAETSAYKNEVDRLTTQIGDLKSTIKNKNNDIKNLNSEILDLKKQIEQLIPENTDTQVVDEVAIEKTEIEENPIKTKNPALERFNYHKQRIGYATVEDGIHYINFVDGNIPKRSVLYNLPVDVMIHYNQFIKVNENYEFLYAFHNVIDDADKSSDDMQLAEVVSLHGGGDDVVVAINGNRITAEGNGRKKWLKLNSVVVLDKFDRIIKIFKPTRLVADSVLPSANAQGIKLYYITQILGNNFIIKNITENGKDDIVNLDLNNNKIEEGNIAMVIDNVIVRVIGIPKFYNNSSIYPKDKLELAIVEIHNGNYLAKKINTGELVMVKHIPLNFTLKEGDLITIDEFNNFAYTKNDQPLSEKTQINSSKKKPESKTISTKPDIKGKVLIIGSPRYRNNYATAFSKEGYEAITIDGIMRNTTDIERESKDVDYIICVKNHISHENFWHVKDKMPSTYKKVYTPLAIDGANRIIDMVINYSKYNNN